MEVRPIKYTAEDYVRDYQHVQAVLGKGTVFTLDDTVHSDFQSGFARSIDSSLSHLRFKSSPTPHMYAKPQGVEHAQPLLFEWAHVVNPDQRNKVTGTEAFGFIIPLYSNERMDVITYESLMDKGISSYFSEELGLYILRKKGNMGLFLKPLAQQIFLPTDPSAFWGISTPNLVPEEYRVS